MRGAFKLKEEEDVVLQGLLPREDNKKKTGRDKGCGRTAVARPRPAPFPLRQGVRFKDETAVERPLKISGAASSHKVNLLALRGSATLRDGRPRKDVELESYSDLPRRRPYPIQDDRFSTFLARVKREGSNMKHRRRERVIVEEERGERLYTPQPAIPDPFRNRGAWVGRRPRVQAAPATTETVTVPRKGVVGDGETSDGSERVGLRRMCGRCRKKGIRCEATRLKNGAACLACRKARAKCEWGIEGDTEGRESVGDGEASSEREGRLGVKQKEPCDRCVEKGVRCDSEGQVRSCVACRLAHARCEWRLGNGDRSALAVRNVAEVRSKKRDEEIIEDSEDATGSDSESYEMDTDEEEIDELASDNEAPVSSCRRCRVKGLRCESLPIGNPGRGRTRSMVRSCTACRLGHLRCEWQGTAPGGRNLSDSRVVEPESEGEGEQDEVAENSDNDEEADGEEEEISELESERKTRGVAEPPSSCRRCRLDRLRCEIVPIGKPGTRGLVRRCTGCRLGHFRCEWGDGTVGTSKSGDRKAEPAVSSGEQRKREKEALEKGRSAFSEGDENVISDLRVLREMEEWRMGIVKRIEERVRKMGSGVTLELKDHRMESIVEVMKKIGEATEGMVQVSGTMVEGIENVEENLRVARDLWGRVEV